MCANDLCAYAHVHVVLVPYRCSALRNREYGNVRCTSAQQAMDIFTTCAHSPLSAHTTRAAHRSQSPSSASPSSVQRPDRGVSSLERRVSDERVFPVSTMRVRTVRDSQQRTQSAVSRDERVTPVDNARAYETPTHSNQCNLAASRVSTTSRCAASWHPLGVQGFVDLRSPLVWSAFHS